jgi:hypothetical protein
MNEQELNNQALVNDIASELSDEALDRATGELALSTQSFATAK